MYKTSHQGEAGLASQGDSLDKAKVPLLLLDHASGMMPIFLDLSSPFAL